MSRYELIRFSADYFLGDPDLRATNRVALQLVEAKNDTV